MDCGHGFSYRLDEIKLQEGKLLTTKQSPAKKQLDLGKKELFVTDHTRVWKGDKQVKLTRSRRRRRPALQLHRQDRQNPGHCTDIWIGADTHKMVTERQRKRSCRRSLKFRGLPAWIDTVDGNKLTVTLFTGDPGAFKQTYMGDFVVGKGDMRVCVANDELRTWNPPVDGERSKLLEIKNGPVDAYGTSGVRMSFTVTNMLEGFRKGASCGYSPRDGRQGSVLWRRPDELWLCESEDRRVGGVDAQGISGAVSVPHRLWQRQRCRGSSRLPARFRRDFPIISFMAI